MLVNRHDGLKLVERWWAERDHKFGASVPQRAGSAGWTTC